MLTVAPSPPPKMAVHESAKRGRRLKNWGTSTVAQSSILTQDLDVLRNRSHAAVRDNPWIKRSVTVKVANEIGTGIVPKPNTSDEDLNITLQQLWIDYVPFADYNGQLTAYGIQGVSSSGRSEGGEVFILIQRTRPTALLPVPVQFQVVESEFCPTSLNHDLLSNGNSIRTGVEINSHGRVIAYWFHKKDPREAGSLNLMDLQRVLAKDVIHHFVQTRPGQLRAVPETVTSLVKAHTFESYNDAELVRKAARADLTGVIERPEYGEEDWKFDPISGATMAKDHQNVGVMELEPGTFVNLLPGEILKLFDSNDAGRGYADYQRWQLLGAAAGVNVPYQLLSGDFSEINDRLWRAIFNEFKREIEYIQYNFIIPQICRRMWVEFVQRAVMSGAITPTVQGFDLYRVNHRPQVWEYIQPVQDGQAKINAINAGLTSRTEVIDTSPNDSSALDVDNQRRIEEQREASYNLRSATRANTTTE